VTPEELGIPPSSVQLYGCVEAARTREMIIYQKHRKHETTHFVSDPISSIIVAKEVGNFLSFIRHRSSRRALSLRPSHHVSHLSNAMLRGVSTPYHNAAVIYFRPNNYASRCFCLPRSPEPLRTQVDHSMMLTNTGYSVRVGTRRARRGERL
jgi:hypothetical protein